MYPTASKVILRLYLSLTGAYGVYHLTNFDVDMDPPGGAAELSAADCDSSYHQI